MDELWAVSMMVIVLGPWTIVIAPNHWALGHMWPMVLDLQWCLWSDLAVSYSRKEVCPSLVHKVHSLMTRSHCKSSICHFRGIAQAPYSKVYLCDLWKVCHCRCSCQIPNPTTCVSCRNHWAWGCQTHWVRCWMVSDRQIWHCFHANTEGPRPTGLQRIWLYRLEATYDGLTFWSLSIS